MTDYRPWDREEKLGSPPWKPDDLKLVAWEKAHGHDVRLKCYPEFGCQLIAERAERIEEAARELFDERGRLRVDANLDAVREALDA